MEGDKTMEKCYINDECYEMKEGIDFSQDTDKWLEFLAELEDENDIMRSLIELTKEKYINVKMDDQEVSCEEYERVMTERIACNASCINFISEKLV